MSDRAAALSRLVDLAHEGVYLGTVGPTATVTEAANPCLRGLLGLSPSTPARDVRPFDAVHLTDPQARAALLDRLASSGSVTDYPLSLLRADGSQAWVEVTAFAGAPDAAGRMRVDALVRDIGERRRAEEQARGLYQQLLQTEKMAALGQTISGVAHELNNPLATILSWAERLSERPALDDSVRRGLSVILGEAERSARIVRNLLTFARKRQSTRTLVDVNAVVHETLALWAYELRITNITVMEALTPDLPQVLADAHQVKQVLLNLLINAEQAMLGAHGRGTVVIRTWSDAGRGVVVLEVRDDGPGVPADVQARIFDPFFTTKEVGKGTGLGLTVAFALVQEHGGRITLRSEPGQGASFFVELPATTEAEAVSAGAAVSAPPVSASAAAGTRVLIVEDETALATAVREAFLDAGYEVDRAGDGEEGLALVAARPYDLVICDLKMPRVDGIRFYRAMAATAPALARRVIFVTGDVAGTEAERFLEDTGCRWLLKPFRLADLLRAAREALA